MDGNPRTAAEERVVLETTRRALQRLRTERGLLDGRIVQAQEAVYAASQHYHEALDREQRRDPEDDQEWRHAG